MTDALLIERFLKGDMGAFNTLVWRWEKPIFNFVLRHIGNEECARDICQTTFIRMYKQLKKLRDPEKFSSWIYQIALNLCRDEFKKKKRYPLYLDDLISSKDLTHSHIEIRDPDTKTPEESYHNRQIEDILKRALVALPEEQRVVIIMKQYQGLKFNEIADILKQPVNTVKSRLYYGLRSLRKLLEESRLSKEVLFHEM